MKTIAEEIADGLEGTALAGDSQIVESLRDLRYYLAPLIMGVPTAGINIVPWYKNIGALVSAVTAEDEQTARHSQRVAEIAMAVGNKLGLALNEMESLHWGSLLHDIGKIAVDPQVKNKPGKLTPEEKRYIDLHAHFGAGIVEPVFGGKVAKMIEHHHNHYDGKGYNQTIIGEDIPLGARIIAVADAFDAMISDRPYRRAMTAEEARQEIMQCTEDQFDPKVVKSFVDYIGQISSARAGTA